MEQYIQEFSGRCELNEELDSKGWNPKMQSVEGSENNNSSGFDCNICLDTVHDPVVTFCGHLYCWPCIYKWIHFKTNSSDKPDHNEPQCPVCKTEVSEKTLIPLYGPDMSTTKSSDRKAPEIGMVIPQRPPTLRCTSPAQAASTRINNPHPLQQIHHRNHPLLHQQFQSYLGGPSPLLGLGGTEMDLSQPIVGMIGDTMYARVFGGPGSTIYAYPSSYQPAGSMGQRTRRRMVAVDRSLSRICFFLFCCMVACLLLF